MERILFVDQFSAFGGAQRLLLDLLRYVRSAGHEVRVALPGPGQFVSLLRSEDFPVGFIPLPRLSAGRKPVIESLTYAVRLRAMARAIEREAEGATLIYANGPRCFLPAALAGRRAGLPVVLAVHILLEHGVQRRVLRWCAARREVRKIVFCSQIAARTHSRTLAGKLQVVPNWVAAEFFTAAVRRSESRRKLGVGGGDLAVGVLGRVALVKGQAFFLEAMLPILSSRPDLRLLFGGGPDFEDPSELERLKTLVEGAGVSHAVRNSGEPVEAASFLDALDILVVPSMADESFGLVAAEGMARGLAVVATRGGGLGEIVVHETTGLLADRSAESLRAAVTRLLDDQNLRERLGEAARARAESLFRGESRLRQLAELCEDAIKGWAESRGRG